MNYYNEFDPKAAAWLGELIKASMIPQGHVDTRSIADVQPHELSGYAQCHFFAGIGGWSLALQLAGWPADEPVWTGSCPCQPFSNAGKQLGISDERHLWPVFRELVRECSPPVVFGEQVASKLGREWLSGVRTDLEKMGYAVGASDLCAAGVGAPHIRQRLYWVAHADGRHSGAEREQRSGQHGQQPQDGGSGRLAHADGRQRNGVADGEGCESNRTQAGREQGNCEPEFNSSTCRMGDSEQQRLEGHSRNGDDRGQPGRERSDSVGPASATSGAWDSFDTLPCTDGKTRRIEPGSFPLAHGIPARMVRLRGYGNAIVPSLAQKFIEAARAVIR